MWEIITRPKIRDILLPLSIFILILFPARALITVFINHGYPSLWKYSMGRVVSHSQEGVGTRGISYIQCNAEVIFYVDGARYRTFIEDNSSKDLSYICKDHPYAYLLGREVKIYYKPSDPDINGKSMEFLLLDYVGLEFVLLLALIAFVIRLVLPDWLLRPQQE